MNVNQGRHNPSQKDASFVMDLNERERLRMAARLARAEYAVDFWFAAGNALARLVVSLAARLRHGMTSGKSWFAH